MHSTWSIIIPNYFVKKKWVARCDTFETEGSGPDDWVLADDVTTRSSRDVNLTNDETVMENLGIVPIVPPPRKNKNRFTPPQKKVRVFSLLCLLSPPPKKFSPYCTIGYPHLGFFNPIVPI